MQNNSQLQESLLINAPSDAPKANNKCCLYFTKTIKFIWNITSYIILWSIICEIILLSTVYVHDKIFFILSLIFLILPIGITSVLTMIINAHNNRKCYLYIPILNVPLYTCFANDTNDNFQAKTMDILLTGLMSFPLYIINLSYLLKYISHYNDIQMVNGIQIILSFMNLVINPIKFILAAYEETNGKCNDVLTKIKIFLISLIAF
eukprot:120297_1